MISEVESFYEKENRSDYFKKYEEEHGPRLDYCIDRFSLKEIKDQSIADFGCGYGFLLKRLNESNSLYGYDSADLEGSDLLCDLSYDKTDLNYPIDSQVSHDISFCFETLEHLENPYRCLLEIKKLTKPEAYIYISLPHVSVTHNTIYPSLIYPHQNFEVFLSQMALPIEDYDLFTDGWKTHVWKCRNAEWAESIMVFPKTNFKVTFTDGSGGLITARDEAEVRRSLEKINEELDEPFTRTIEKIEKVNHEEEQKFRGVTPVEATNI